MLDIFDEYRKVIISEIEIFFDTLRSRPIIKDFWFEDAIERLHKFVISGKMLRGAMVILSEKMFSNKYFQDALKCAITVELLQSGLLIHDDIMDEDTQRRGMDTIFYQYKKLSDERNIENSYHIGEAMGICAGNLAFSLAFLSLGRISRKHILDRLILKFGEEMAIVGIGQMKDVMASGLKDVPSEDEIISIYRYKTARYSFSLPFALGAIISEVDDETIHKIEEIGEYLGIIFQIQDDRIGLVGDSSLTGKPRGSDIKENKKTIFYNILINLVTDDEKQSLMGIFGNRYITDKEIDYVIGLCRKYNVFDIVEEKVKEYSIIVKNKVSELQISDEYKRYFYQFIDYNLSRDR